MRYDFRPTDLRDEAEQKKQRGKRLELDFLEVFVAGDTDANRVMVFGRSMSPWLVKRSASFDEAGFGDHEMIPDVIPPSAPIGDRGCVEASDGGGVFLVRIDT